MKTDKERMLLLLDYLKMNPNGLATSLGYKRTDKIYHVLNERNGISSALAKDISEKHPINYKWLLGADVEMVKEQPTEEPPNEKIQALKERIMALQAAAPIAMGTAQATQATQAATAKATERGLRGIVQRWELTSPTKAGILIPKAKEQPENSALKAFVEHFNTLARVNPNKAIWLMTGEENSNFVNIAEVMVKDKQIKGLRIVNDSLAAENEMLKNKIKELTSISEQLVK